MKSISVAFLVGLSNLLGINSLPSKLDSWKLLETWKNQEGIETISFSSKDIIQSCKLNPEAYVEFPSVIHGAHELFLDGKKILTFSDPTFQNIRSFYGAPVIECKDIMNGSEVLWKVYSYTKYFARISEEPKLVNTKPYGNVFNELLNIICAIALVLLAGFSFITSFGKLTDQDGRKSNKLVWALCGSNIFLCGYFFWCSPSFFNAQYSMLFAHRLADTSVWIGLYLFIHTLAMLGLISKLQLKIFTITVVPAVLIILTSQTGDTIQFGTSLPFGMILFLLFYALVSQIKSIRATQNNTGFYSGILKTIGLSFWILSVINDILLVTGLRGGYVMMSTGSVGGFFFFALALQEQILSTYKERDFLRLNLEKEVERKTSQLRHKSEELEQAMIKVRQAQADLIQSEKLASLGTLAAGIAHEINNAVNFVSNSIPTIQKSLALIPDQKKRDTASILIGSMKNGVNVIVRIVESLRSYTGLNQGKFKKVSISEVVDSVITLTKSKIEDGNVKIELSLEENSNVYGNSVGLHQLFMNLITNAVDAMEGGGVLSISSKIGDTFCEIKVSDTGSGIPNDILDKIFNPFFTTKEAGKGTGLGLHIVKQQVESHNGSIKIDSGVGKGTSFIIRLPIDLGDLEGAVA
jgi:signal transduction histidine kinase